MTRKRILIVTAIAGGFIAAAAVPPGLFVASDRCIACHNGLATPRGEDVSIGSDWRASMMAHAARDPYWQASVRRETLAHPGAAAAIEHECAACHMPMTRYEAKAAGGKGQVFAHLPIGGAAAMASPLAADGVSCSVCHQIGPEKLGTPESFTAGFVLHEPALQGRRQAFGPFQTDDGRKVVMLSSAHREPAEGPHIRESGLCATCHTLYTHALNDRDEVVGELPEQVPFLEWRHSAYADSRACQSCHMPEVEGEMPVTSVVGQLRENVSRHVFRGGNIFMPRVLNLHRDALGVEAQPLELETTARRTAQHLETSSAVVAVPSAGVEGGRLRAEIVIENMAGHKLPTAYPSRRAWLHVTVHDRAGTLVFESGRLNPDGSIAGNDSDADPGRYEPHYADIESAEQVQIYESILADENGAVTTVLLSGVRYAKDNRILPDGFDKDTADEDVAVLGRAAEDADFAGGGDRVRYTVPIDPGRGPFRVRAELWYQPISFRWARNLDDRPTAEGARFLGYYRGMSGVTAVLLARAETMAR